MLQLRIEGHDIDLYDLDPPKLNFSIEDIRDTSARSMFSRTFRIPATSKNTEYFDTAFDINGVDFDVRQQRPAELLVNGILFRTGQVRLNKVFDSREGARLDYEIIFLGETKDFGTSVGEGFLNELDLSDLDHEITISNIELSWQAYPEGSITDGLLNGDVIYPIIDFGNTYKSNGDITNNQVVIGSGQNGFNSSLTPLPLRRLKPMVRAKNVVDAIFEEAGYTYTSNFFDSNLFKQMYLSAFGNTTNLDTEGASNIAAIGLSSNAEPSFVVPFNLEYWDYGNNFSPITHSYTAPQTGVYQLTYNLPINASSSIFGGGTLTSQLRKNGTVILASDSETFIGDAGFTLSNTITTTLNSGDTIDVRMLESGSIDIYAIFSQAYFQVLDAPGIVSISPLLDNKYKKIDFIKDLLTKFRLVMIPDNFRDKRFIIEPWEEFIGTGGVLDWTKKLDVSKDFIIEPLFYTQQARINYEDKSGEDFLNRFNTTEFNEVFGALTFNGNNDFLSGERKITTNIIPTPITQIRNNNTSIGQSFIIPRLSSEEPGTQSPFNPQYRPIVANSRLLFYNGLKDTDGLNYYLEGSSNNPYDEYPMVSFYEDFPNNNSSLNLNWQKETGYINFNQNDGLIGKSVYDNYWAGYINSLYDGYSRKVSAYFILDDTDLTNFNFNNVIFVKNAYYYVNKIVDAVIGKKTSVKVELIKLRNYKVRITPIRPRRIWDEQHILWENAAFKWDL